MLKKKSCYLFPLQAHIALAEAEKRLMEMGRRLTVITQNIDGLHQRAGSKEVVELHGSLYKTLCLKCHTMDTNYDSPICPSLQGRGCVFVIYLFNQCF